MLKHQNHGWCLTHHSWTLPPKLLHQRRQTLAGTPLLPLDVHHRSHCWNCRFAAQTSCWNTITYGRIWSCPFRYNKKTRAPMLRWKDQDASQVEPHHLCKKIVQWPHCIDLVQVPQLLHEHPSKGDIDLAKISPKQRPGCQTSTMARPANQFLEVVIAGVFHQCASTPRAIHRSCKAGH